MAKLPDKRGTGGSTRTSGSEKLGPGPRSSRRNAPPGGSQGQSVPDNGSVEFAGVRLTHPDRVLWAEQGLTKQQLAEYYLEIADWVLPHVVGRPLALVRCPSGAEKGCFFQKHPWAGLAESVIRKTLPDSRADQEVLLVQDIRGVIGLVQAGVLEIHPWGATFEDIERPDRVVFDFDPGEGVIWSEVVASARDVRDRLGQLGLQSFAKTTGGKGLHVVVPLAPQAGWAAVKAFARSLSEAMEADSPERYLTRAAKGERKGRVFIDYMRNARGATAVAAYSTRARPGAPVSTPLIWEELSDERPSNHYTVENLPRRLRDLKNDPWTGFDRLRQLLPKGPPGSA